MRGFNSCTSNLPDYIQNDDTVYTPTPDMYLADDIPKTLISKILSFRVLDIMSYRP